MLASESYFCNFGIAYAHCEITFLSVRDCILHWSTGKYILYYDQGPVPVFHKMIVVFLDPNCCLN